MRELDLKSASVFFICILCDRGEQYPCLLYTSEQREIIYKERRRVLDGENMRDAIYKMITDIVDNTVDMCISDEDVYKRQGNQREGGR